MRVPTIMANHKRKKCKRSTHAITGNRSNMTGNSESKAFGHHRPGVRCSRNVRNRVTQEESTHRPSAWNARTLKDNTRSTKKRKKLNLLPSKPATTTSQELVCRAIKPGLGTAD